MDILIISLDEIETTLIYLIILIGVVDKASWILIEGTKMSKLIVLGVADLLNGMFGHMFKVLIAIYLKRINKKNCTYSSISSFCLI